MKEPPLCFAACVSGAQPLQCSWELAQEALVRGKMATTQVQGSLWGCRLEQLIRQEGPGCTSFWSWLVCLQKFAFQEQFLFPRSTGRMSGACLAALEQCRGSWDLLAQCCSTHGKAHRAPQEAGH